MARMEGITVEVEVVMVGELIRNQVVEKKKLKLDDRG
jgi:hypothetical protein